ncbi:MAG TPA: LysR family transcriptional regulator [Actinophytocola sp.]|nr:LysR family transcriptional regulator [Actinophytocola sp.]
MIDLRRLHVLRALAEHGTVTSAAAALHLTPSAVSQQLRQLAREVDAVLLRPEGRRVRLTQAAHILLDHADVLHTQWELARADLAAHSGRIAGTLRIAGVSSTIAALVAPAVAGLRTSHPLLRSEILEEESGDCHRLLLADEVDLAVVLPNPEMPPVTDPRFEHQPLLDDPQDLLVPDGHPLARRGGVELAEAAGEDWVVKRHNNDTHPLLIAAATAAGFTPRIAHQVKEWYAVSAMVAEGFGVCLLPRLVPLPAHHQVIRVPIRGVPKPYRRILTCVRRGGANHPVVATGLAALHTIAGSLRTDQGAPTGGR